MEEAWFGLAPTGRQQREPAATLHEAQDRYGLRHTVLAYDAAYRGHPAIARNVDLVASFLAHPMVLGLVDLMAYDTAQGRFAYPTGEFFTLREVQRHHSDHGQTMGARAALEMAFLVGQILVEASENGASVGCFCHGGLTPWRIGVRPQGEVIVIGHGLPQVEVVAHREDSEFAVSADSVRYATPERLAGQPEDTPSDTASLAAIAYEIIAGKPLYDSHDVEQLTKAISLTEAISGLRAGGALTKEVAAFIAESLTFDPETRLSGRAWVDRAGALLAKETGATLADVAGRMKAPGAVAPRRALRIQSTETSQFTPQQLQALVDEADEAEDAEQPEEVELAPVEPRWGKPSRAAAEETSSEDAPAASGGAEPTRQRRRTLDPAASAASQSILTDGPLPEVHDADAPTRQRRRADAGDAVPRTRRRRRDEP